MICRESIAQILSVQLSGAVQFFGISDGHGVAALQLCHAHLYPSCYVLSEVDDGFITRFLQDGGTDCFHHLHAFHHLSAQGAQRDAHAFGVHPLLVVIVGHGPLCPLLACVVDFTVVFVVRAQCAIHVHFPFRVGDYGLLRAVGKFHYQVGAQSGIAKVGNLVGLFALLHGVESAIAQHHADGIVFVQHLCHVVSIVEHGASVVGG